RRKVGRVSGWKRRRSIVWKWLWKITAAVRAPFSESTSLTRFIRAGLRDAAEALGWPRPGGWRASRAATCASIRVWAVRRASFSASPVPRQTPAETAIHPMEPLIQSPFQDLKGRGFRLDGVVSVPLALHANFGV